MNVESSTVQPTLSMTVETCLATISQDVESPVQSLYADLAAQKITPQHPLVFIYRDLDGDPNRRFELEVAQPVSDRDLEAYRGSLQPGSLSQMNYVERVHTGTLEDMGERTYAPFFADIAKAGMQPGRECREVYSVYNAVDHADNVTHVQIEVRQ